MTAQTATHNLTEHWKALDSAHHWHPFTDTKDLHGEGGPRVIVKGEGVWLEDSEGNRILDGMAGLWCVNLGYGRPELAEAGYRQMLTLPYYNTFFKTATPPSVELSEALVKVAPKGLNRIFYGSSGSESNDTVVRLVRHYWNLMGRPEKKTFIGREMGYHGSTLAGTSLGGMSAMHGQADLPLPGFVHVMAPYHYKLAEPGESEHDFGIRAARAVEDRILELGADNVAAFIGEPIMGAGGLIFPPDSYWPEVQRICRKYDVLVVADEVICGFGRTGNWFASQHFGIEPDLMTTAKGISSGYVPLSAVFVGDRVANAVIEKGGEFYHGYTYSGHPVACAVALENLRILHAEGIVERVREDTGPYLHARLHETFDDHPLVGQVRGFGMLAAMELMQDKAAGTFFEPEGEVGLICRDLCFENDLVMRATRDVMLLSPPLTITRAEIDTLVERAKRAIDQTAERLARG